MRYRATFHGRVVALEGHVAFHPGSVLVEPVEEHR